MANELTVNDLLWLIGQKEADLLVLRRQAHIVAEDNKRLTSELEALKATEKDAKDG